MFVVTVTFEIAADKTEAFRAAILKQAKDSLQGETACRRFDICVDPDRSERFFLYEIYDDAAAFDAHLESAHFRAFDEKVSAWVRQKSVVTWQLIG